MGDAQLTFYNTLTRQKEPFRPIDPSNVRMYVCGPTVYDFAHIGNARPVIVFDVLYRLLRHVYGEDHVTYVRNITDVDDKINARALRDHPDLPLNEAIRAVTEKTERQFHADVKALGCLQPTVEPRATEFVLARADGKTDMVSLIQSLIDRGHAYEAAGEILFDIGSMPDYGRLSNRRLEDQQAGARVAVEAHKKNPGDFVLWKESAADEPGWDASFKLADRTVTIRGRPGWHIECSAMSAAYLGETFDIHGGGLDLIFPHHENEIAQSRCAHGTPVMANLWMHNGFLQVEGRKMAKSEGNFVTIRDNLRGTFPGWKGGPWHGLVLRTAMLSTHYREPIDWRLDTLLQARARMSKWSMVVSNWRVRNSFRYEREGFQGVASEPFDECLAFLSDDLNTPETLGTLDRYLPKSDDDVGIGRLIATLLLLGLLNDRSLNANPVVASQWVPDRDDREAYRLAFHYGIADANGDVELKAEISDRMRSFGWKVSSCELGGIDLDPIAKPQRPRIKELVDRRLGHIRDRNWPEADRIRDELLAQGIQLKDAKDSQTGERITTWEVKR